jgi:hypothetical protein
VWLIDHREVLHFQREGVTVRTYSEATLWNRHDPVKSRRRDGRMNIVYLVCGDRRSPEQRQSYVGEDALLCCPGRPILSLYNAVVGCGTTKRDAISLIVSAHAREGAAPGDATLEMEDM